MGTSLSNITCWAYQVVKTTCSLVFFFLRYLLSLWESAFRMRRTSPLTQYQTLNPSALYACIFTWNYNSILPNNRNYKNLNITQILVTFPIIMHAFEMQHFPLYSGLSRYWVKSRKSKPLCLHSGWPEGRGGRRQAAPAEQRDRSHPPGPGLLRAGGRREPPFPRAGWRGAPRPRSRPPHTRYPPPGRALQWGRRCGTAPPPSAAPAPALQDRTRRGSEIRPNNRRRLPGADGKGSPAPRRTVPSTAASRAPAMAKAAPQRRQPAVRRLARRLCACALPRNMAGPAPPPRQTQRSRWLRAPIGCPALPPRLPTRATGAGTNRTARRIGSTACRPLGAAAVLEGSRDQGPAGGGRHVGAAPHHPERAQQRLLLRDQPVSRPALPGAPGGPAWGAGMRTAGPGTAGPGRGGGVEQRLRGEGGCCRGKALRGGGEGEGTAFPGRREGPGGGSRAAGVLTPLRAPFCPQGSRQLQEKSLKISSTLYVGNLSFYTTEEQIQELFSKCGDVKRIVMGLDKIKKTPCGFCFVEYLFWLSAAVSPCVVASSSSSLHSKLSCSAVENL